MMAGEVLEADLLCRVCAAPHYGEKVDLQAIPALMEFYIWLSHSMMNDSDLLPKQICMPCYDRLDEFHRFRSMCTESHNLLCARFSKCIISKGGECFEISFKDETSDIPKNEFSFNTSQEPEKMVNIISQYNKNTSINYGDGEYSHPSDYDDQLGGSYKLLQSDGDQHSEIDIKPDIDCFNYSALLDMDKEDKKVKSNELKKNSTPIKNIGYFLHEGKTFLYRCNKCPKKFNVKERYEGHLRWHQGLKQPFACKDCQKKYSRLERLRNHILSDHSDRPRRFYCTVAGCNKKYKNRETLKKHINMHSRRQISDDQELTGVDLLGHPVFADTSYASGFWDL